MAKMIQKVEQVARHHNGIAGAPFYAVLFQADNRPMVGLVFDEPGRVAVLDRQLAWQGNVLFGENSWRGDEYEPELRAAIAKHERTELRTYPAVDRKGRTVRVTIPED